MSGEWTIIGAVAAALMLLGYFAVSAAISEQNEWAEFARAHQCKVVGRTAAHNTFGGGFDSKGRYITTTQFVPSTTGYLCDDGVAYWK